MSAPHIDARWMPRPGLHRVRTPPRCRAAQAAAEAIAAGVAAGLFAAGSALVLAPAPASMHRALARAGVAAGVDLDAVAVHTPLSLAALLLRRCGAEGGLRPDATLTVAPDPALVAAVVADFWAVSMAKAPVERVRGLGSVRPESLRAWVRAAARWPEARLQPEAPQTDPRAGLAAVLGARGRVDLPARMRAAGRVTPGLVFRALAEAGERALAADFAGAWVLDAPSLDPAAWQVLAPLAEGAGGLWLLGDAHRTADPVGVAALVRLTGEPPFEAAGDAVDPALVAAEAWLFDARRVGPAFDGQRALDGPDVQRSPTKSGKYDVASALVVRWFVPEPGAEPSAAVAEAVAQAVAEQVRAGAAPRTIAVVAEWAEAASALAVALQAQGVPVDHRAARDPFAGAVAAALSHALTAALTRDPGQVRAVLAGPLGGWSAAALAALAEDEAALNVRMAEARGWGERWSAAGVWAAVRALRNDLKVDARWRHLPHGAAWGADLDRLTDALQARAAAGGLGPAALLAWFEAARAHAAEAGAAPVVREGQPQGVKVGPSAVLSASAGDARFDAVWLPFAWQAAPPPAEPQVVLDGAGALTVDVRGAEAPEAHRRGTLVQARALDRRRLRAGLGLAARQVHLVSGPLPAAHEGPLAWLLDPEPDWPDRVPARAQRRKPEDVQALAEATLADAAAQLGAPLRLVMLPAAASLAFSALPEAEAGDVPSTPPAGGVLTGWRRTSFSGLTHGAEHVPVAAAPPDAPVGDDDTDLLAAPIHSASGRALPLATLPRGPVMGTCIHGILERTDFADAGALATQVVAGLDAAGLDVALAPTLTAGLLAAIQTPLEPPTAEPRLSLAALPRSARIDELSFVLPVRPEAPVTPASLAETLARHPGPGLPLGYAERLAALPFAPFEGFLSGSIDLVFRWRGRWAFADYKSNDLGTLLDDYAPGRLEAAMVEGHYVLQAHLYAVALRRFLRARLGPTAASLGPACYLFLRGLDPTAGPARGLWTAELPEARLDALDALFGGAR